MKPWAWLVSAEGGGKPKYDPSAMIMRFLQTCFTLDVLRASSDGLAWEERGPLDIRLATGAPIPEGPRGAPAEWHENGVW